MNAVSVTFHFHVIALQIKAFNGKRIIRKGSLTRCSSMLFYMQLYYSPGKRNNPPHNNEKASTMPPDKTEIEEPEHMSMSTDSAVCIDEQTQVIAEEKVEGIQINVDGGDGPVEKISISNNSSDGGGGGGGGGSENDFLPTVAFPTAAESSITQPNNNHIQGWRHGDNRNKNSNQLLPSQPLPPTQDAILADLPPDDQANENLCQMDRCLDFVSEPAHQIPSGWDEKSQAAAEKTIQNLVSIERVKSQYYDDDDSDDSLPPGCAHNSTPEIGLSLDEKRFIRALPSWSQGFPQHARNRRNRRCPCGPSLKDWRKQLNLHIDVNCGKNTKNFTPDGLIEHLKKEGGCYNEKIRGKMESVGLKDIYHHATKIYLQNLYSNC